MDPQHSQNDKRDKKKEVLKTIADFLPEWGKLKYEEVRLDRMAGITNETYKVSHPAIEGALIYR